MSKRPVCVRIVWDVDGDGFGDGAHFVVIHGYDERNGIRYVEVKDPLAGQISTPAPVANSEEVEFEEFRTRYHLTGTWLQTYLVK